MPNINEFFPSKYLKASDLNGKEPVVTIKKVVREEVGQKRDMKPIVYFEKVGRGLVLNKTNANKIIQIAGSGVTEDWKGVQIVLFSTEVEFQGDTVDAIRIKAVGSSKKNTRPDQQTPGDVFESAAVETAREAIGDDDDSIPF